jgi:enoyl-CoA hydratase/carnithine racemase
MPGLWIFCDAAAICRDASLWGGVIVSTVSKGIEVSRDGAVARVTFARPPSNYFDLDLIVALADTLEDIDLQPDLRAVVLRSEGKVFCAGAKFVGAEGAAAQPGAGDLADPRELYRNAIRLFRTRKPIVAAIQGAAIGGGLGLAMIADFRIAAPEARFAANFVTIGIHAGFGLTHTLPRAIGEQAAAMLLYTGRRIDGAEAYRMGLVDLLAQSSELQSAALALTSEIAKNAPLAVEATRKTLRNDLADRVAQQIEREAHEQMRLFGTADFKEGVKAVAERREGRWVRG